jgi:hypothetical protein
MSESETKATRMRPFKGSERLSVSEFCDHHGIHRWLVPFPHRKTDPWDFLNSVNQSLTELNDYTATIRPSDVFTENELNGGSVAHQILRLRGSYPIDDTKHTQWTNPEYAHGQNYFEPVADREDHARRLASAGWFELSDLCERYGINNDVAMQRWLSRRGLTWTDLRREGRRRIARSIKTTHKWSDLSIAECKRRLPMNDNTLETWIRRYVYNSEWEAPAEPIPENADLMRQHDYYG